LSKVEHDAIDCGFGDWREVGTIEEDVSFISRDLEGETQGALSFGIRGVLVSVTKMGVGRDEVGGLSSKSKNRELVVRNA
jgi:hypothetical protein